MIPFLRVRENGDYASPSINCAKEGFDELGIKTKTYQKTSDIPLERECMVVGFVNEVRGQLTRLRIPTPEIDYPEELRSYLGRKIEKTTLFSAETFMYENPRNRYFIKPVIDKQFEGSFLEHSKDLKKFQYLSGETEIWISEFMNFEAEYRCYIYKKDTIKGICKYKGYTKGFPDFTQAERMAYDFTSAPAAYTIDLGLVENQLYLIEVNDGYSVQNYGLSPRDYANWLMVRWRELVDLSQQ